MEVINLKSKLINNYTHMPISITINGRMVSFPTASVKEFGLKAGQYVHFLNDGRQWSFIVNDDRDGFPLQREKRQDRDGLRIFNAALCNLFKKSLQLDDEGGKYYLQLTNRVFKDCKVIEILTAKQIDKMGKET